MKIENRPVINKQTDFYALNKKFKLELLAKEEEIDFLECEKDKLMNRVNSLEKQVKD